VPGIQQPVSGETSEYDQIEAVLETTMGQIVIEFFPQDAPRHVEYFVKQARAGTYDRTTFHRVIQNGLIQGGDPTTKNPALRARYGSGGLKAGIPDEVNRNKHLTGAVSAALSVDLANPSVVLPGTSGSQFFIVVGPQPTLDDKFTVFGRVIEGMDVAAKISNIPAVKASGLATQRVEITKLTIREKTPTVEQMKAMQMIIETSLGNIKLQLMPEAAPNTARAFVRYVRSGIYDDTNFFRVSGAYYLEGGNLADWAPESPNRKRFHSLWPIAFEKNEVKQMRGTLSLRQAQEGTTSWYYFIISTDNPALDGKHVPVAKVISGLEVVDKIAQTEVGEGDRPKQRIDIKRITIQ
jgi:peptidyl-prolyl cis-trans isomerase B (cyclophilin B)